MTSPSREMVRRVREQLGVGPRMGRQPSGALAVVTCMDTRVDPLLLFRARLGEIHAIENAGGVVTRDVLRSLHISQRYMGTRRIAIVMHTDCGLLGLEDDTAGATAEAPLPFDLGGFANLEARLRESVGEVRKASYLPRREDVRGYIHDVERRRLAEAQLP